MMHYYTFSITLIHATNATFKQTTQMKIAEKKEKKPIANVYRPI